MLGGRFFMDTVNLLAQSLSNQCWATEIFNLTKTKF